MRVAALFDIHANLPALEAVLDEVREAGADRIVIGGDVVPGPMVRETLDRLARIDVPVTWIVGNGERAVSAMLRGLDPGPMPDAAREVVSWSAEELRNGDWCSIFDRWPMTSVVTIPPIGPVLFCHGTPRHENEIFTRLTAEEKLRPIFDNLGAGVVVCGHTHMQFDRTIGSLRVVNAGSVGMPFGATGADWILLGAEIEFRHTIYDLEVAARRIRASRYPQAEEFAAKNVLSAPAEVSMLELLGRAELRYGPSAGA